MKEVTFSAQTSKINNQNNGHKFKMDHLDLGKAHYSVLFQREDVTVRQDRCSSTDLGMGSTSA